MGKKKKRAGLELEPAPELQEAINNNESQNVDGDDSHDNKKHKKNKKRDKQNDDAPKDVPTVSIAVPGSIIDNTQSLELATRVRLLSRYV